MRNARDLIVIGGSAGAVEAVLSLASQLPADLPAAVCLVIHFPQTAPTVMPQLLSRRGALVAIHARDGEAIRHGRIYVAPPGRHLMVEDGHFRLVMGPRENGHRPAIDPLFRSAAQAYGSRVIGVVLSGNLDDGTAGLQTIKRCGGTAVVQSPEDALYPSMPRNALERVDVDHVVRLDELAAMLTTLLGDGAQKEGAMPLDDPPGELQHDIGAAKGRVSAIEDADRPGAPSGFSCPECNGSLWEIRDGSVVRYRCRVGHAYTSASLLDEQSRGIETALWTALRALEENVAFCSRLADRASERGSRAVADRYRHRAEHARGQAALIRGVLDGVDAVHAVADG